MENKSSDIEASSSQTLPPKRNSLLSVPTRTSSKNQPSPTSTVDTSGNALAETNSTSARKRKKRKDGDGSSVNTGHSTTEGRTHKSHHGGGISKFFSVFLNCCRAPDSAHGVSDDESPSRRARKPQSVRRSTQVDVSKDNLKDSGIGTESKDVVVEEKKTDGVLADRAVPAPVDTREQVELSEKTALQTPVVVGEKLTTVKPTPTKEEGAQTIATPESTPLVVTEEIDSLRPSTSSPVPQTVPPKVEDVVMTDAETENKLVPPKAEVEPIPVAEEEIIGNMGDKEVVDEAGQQLIHEGALVESPPLEPKQFLLPPIKPEFQGKKCLVLDLDETLVHSSFKLLHQADFTIPVEIEGTYHNVYVIKRPGVDQFMKRVGELYEVVVFTASVSKYGDPLLDQLDVNGVVHHRLFRESCCNHQGNYVKDLSQLGRDLKDTIIIDNSPTSYIFHPQHAVPISSWFSDAHDNELLDLIPVLEDLSGAGVRDVSMVLDVSM